MPQLGGIPGLIPARWIMPEKAIKYDEIIFVNWLEVEMPQPVKMPLLDRLTNWRNREVYMHVQSYDWTARMYDGSL